MYKIEISKLKNNYYALRHGKSVANEERIIVSDPENGIESYGLCPEGELQAFAAAKRIKKINLENIVIVTSDFKRAFETAKIVSDNLSLQEPVLSQNLRERFFGNFEKTSDENYALIWKNDLEKTKMPFENTESVYSVVERISRLIDDIENNYESRNIVLVSHGDALQILQTCFMNIEPHLHRSVKHLETAVLRKLS